MARRGFFAELQHQAQIAERERARASREAERAHRAAIREAERAQKAAERAIAQQARAAAAEEKRLEKEARAAHIALMEARVGVLNSELANTYEEIDSLLTATLAVDDYVDLEQLRRTVEHPPFDRVGLETPIPPPETILEPPEPVLRRPSPPKGIFASFKKRKHDQEVARANVNYETEVFAWETRLAEVRMERAKAAKLHKANEEMRLVQLETERRRYDQECAARAAEVEQHNADLDVLVANLAYGVQEAVEEYISIVLANSVYPAAFSVAHEFSFEAKSAELALNALMPAPSEISDVKHYRYKKSSDEITATSGVDPQVSARGWFSESLKDQ